MKAAARLIGIDVVASVSLVCGMAAVLGWSQGYHALVSFLVFWLFGVLSGASAVRIERLAFGPALLTDRIIRSLVILFSLIVMCGLLLGSIGWVGRVSYLVFFGLCFALSMRAAAPQDPPPPIRAPAGGAGRMTLVVAMVVPILVFVVATGISHLPSRYDSLNYHLYLPGQWLQTGRISIVPTPFGDEAPAYAPSNGELFFLSLMLPFHGDLLARIGQFPFYLLIAVVMYVLARRAGARGEHAIYPVAFFLLARPIVEEAVGADVDLIFTAMFLAAVYLGLIALERNARNDWAVFGASAGLCCGTKYVALVYLPVFLVVGLWGLMRGPRLRALWALPGVGVLALPWYVRNWVVAGSPIYPASLTLAGRTLAPGAFTHGAMTNSIFHVADIRIFPIIADTAFGGSLFLFWIPFAAVGTILLLTTSTSWLARSLVLLPIALIALDWFGVPDNTDPRFLFPVVALGLLPLAFVFRHERKWDGAMHVLFGAGLVWLIVSINATIEVPLATLPFFMRDALSLHPLVARAFLPLFFVLALAVAAGRAWLGPGRTLCQTALAFVAACTLIGAGSRAVCGGEGCEFLDLTPSYIKDTMFEGWRWVHDQAHGETIAYAGNNIPYPLFGERLTNRVYYVNIDRHVDWKLHDYDRARRRRQDEPGESSPILATSSGVLTPEIPENATQADAVRPRFERMRGYRDAWVSNLKQRGVTLLFVSTLSAYEINNVWHDADGFPIEAEWARADPVSFRPVFRNSQVSIYAVTLK